MILRHRPARRSDGYSPDVDFSSAQPLVSIITPSFNQGAYISETIQSIRNQTYPSIEHIVVDAESTDETLAILEHESRQGHLRFVSEPDAGMYAGINKGLRMARGEILAYLNTDDLYLPWTVATAVERLLCLPRVGFVFGDVVRYDTSTFTGLLLVTPPFRHGFIVRRGFLTQPTVFWRRDVIDRHGFFDDSLTFVADCDYWMRIGAHTPGAKISEILALERDHAAAKRFTSPEPLRLELDRVRRNHGASRRWREWLSDRSYGYVWQVWLTIAGALRAAGVLPAGRFPYRNGFGTATPSIPRLLLSRVPVVGRRVSWNIQLARHPSPPRL